MNVHFDAIRPGDRVTITNRFGQLRTGRAVMTGPAGFVLDMGGRHGTPDIATPENTVRVRKASGVGDELDLGALVLQGVEDAADVAAAVVD